MTKNKSEKIDQKKWNTLLWRIGNDISDWRKKITETLKFNPDPENLVQFKCQDKEEKKAILSNPEFLDEHNFRLQIWKMQENWWTLYNDITLWLWIEYMINHTKKWGHSVIQIWSDVWENLQKWAEEWVLSAQEEKEKLEKFIKKNFWKKWEVIKVEIWSEKYPEVFEAISKWKKWIIPNKEPNLESMIPFNSPLQIIEYLAYNASKDEKLMELFQNTKPIKYLAEDKRSHKKPGESDADFYGIVEVWLRLFEVLNWISIQWWLGRQRVYDKIISLIINWEDVIKWKEEFNCNYELSPKNYPALEKLHKVCKEHYPDTKFNQLYIELYRWGKKGGIEEIERKLDEKKDLKSKLRMWGYWGLAAIALAAATWYTASRITKHRYEQAQERFEQERQDMHRQYSNKVFKNSISIWESEWASEYFEEQANILISKYNISSLNKENSYDDIILIKNDIIGMYKYAFDIKAHESHQNFSIYSKINTEELTDEEYHNLFWFLTAEEFMDKYGWEIIDKYHIPYQEPYEHLKQYKNAIENTLKYWNKIDISKYKTKEISTKSDLSYVIEWERWQYKYYRLKIIRVYLDGWKTIDLIVAKQDKRRRMKNKHEDKSGYNLEDWTRCVKDLYKHNILL